MIDKIKQLIESGEDQIQNIFDRISAKYLDGREAEHRACIFWAGAVSRFLESHGYDVLLQGGSASFQFIKPGSQADDNVSPTHYSYECLDSAAYLSWLMEQPELPEMHAWVVVRWHDKPMRYVFVDWTTRYLIELCALKGFKWTEPEPPRTFIGEAKDCPDGWFYQAKHDATKFLLALEQASFLK